MIPSLVIQDRIVATVFNYYLQGNRIQIIGISSLRRFFQMHVHRVASAYCKTLVCKSYQIFTTTSNYNMKAPVAPQKKRPGSANHDLWVPPVIWDKYSGVLCFQKSLFQNSPTLALLKAKDKISGEVCNSKKYF